MHTKNVDNSDYLNLRSSTTYLPNKMSKAHAYRGDVSILALLLVEFEIVEVSSSRS